MVKHILPYLQTCKHMCVFPMCVCVYVHVFVYAYVRVYSCYMFCGI